MMERRREVGLLEVVGARRSEIMGLIVGEKALVGFVAGVLGVGLLGSIWYIFRVNLENVSIPFVGQVFKDMVLPLWVMPVGILFSTLFGASISGAILRYTLRTPPAGLLRNM